MWATVLVVGVGSAVGGYVIGFREGEEKATAIHASAAGSADGSAAGSAEAARGGANEGRFEGIARREAGDPYALGEVDAPVVISEFSDFECPYCAKYSVETAPEIVKEYVDKGVVRIEFNDFPAQGPKSLTGARAGRAAAEQGKFFEFAQALHEEAYARGGHPDFEMEDYVAAAQKAGVADLEKFKADAASDKFDAAIDADRSKGMAAGVNGTPAFVIGNQLVAGAQPFDVFKDAIEQELAKAES
ncbi:thioredoxin domain-containing protein [Corynebacterium aquatimens]